MRAYDPAELKKLCFGYDGTFIFFNGKSRNVRKDTDYIITSPHGVLLLVEKKRITWKNPRLARRFEVPIYAFRLSEYKEKQYPLSSMTLSYMIFHKFLIESVLTFEEYDFLLSLD